MRDIIILLAFSVGTLVLSAALQMEATSYIPGVLGLGLGAYLFGKLRNYHR